MNTTTHNFVTIFLLLLVMIPNFATAATISGRIYDFMFDTVKDSVVEINTQPKQIIVSKDGRYSFEIPLGDYEITAKKEDYLIRENITVKYHGNYTLDLILLPSFEEEDEISRELDDAQISSNIDNLSPQSELLKYVLTVSIIAIVYTAFIFKKKLKKNLTKIARLKTEKQIQEKQEKTKEKEIDSSKYINEIIEFIKHEGGRTSQKEIRKHIPLSEAKISLLITELEYSGKIKKIKKGRGNILILN